MGLLRRDAEEEAADDPTRSPSIRIRMKAEPQKPQPMERAKSVPLGLYRYSRTLHAELLLQSGPDYKNISALELFVDKLILFLKSI